VADGAVLGRGRSAAVRLPDARISRRHARLRVGPAGTTVEDLGSKNGIGVNGVRVDRRPVPLRPGDELVAGETALALEDPAPALPALPAAPASAAGTRGPRAPPPHVAAAALLALSALALVVAAS
jgi:S-DNA-T family DNA segregation ATPase FtsK/SpoIIIE